MAVSLIVANLMLLTWSMPDVFEVWQSLKRGHADSAVELHV